MSKKSTKHEPLAVVLNEPVEIDESEAKKPSTEEKAPESKESKDEAPQDKKEAPIEEVPLNDEVSAKKETKEDDEDGPPQPPRPVDPITRITNDLKDAFPTIEEKLITAVLIASQGNVDPAFNALLYISDPSFKPDIPAPVAPSVPPKSAKSGPNSRGKNVGFAGDSGLTDDELLARKLQKEFELEDERRRRRRAEKKKGGAQRPRQQNPGDDSPDEFEQIKETFTQGFEEARTTLNSWVSGIAKKFDGNSDDGEHQPQPPKQNTKLFGALGGSSFNGDNRRKNARFDEDPEIIQHDFHNRISLTDNDKGELPALPVRSREQSDTATGAKTGGQAAPPSAGKKWQPLNSDVPANSDAFLVTDSEDEDTGVANYDIKKKN